MNGPDSQEAPLSQQEPISVGIQRPALAPFLCWACVWLGFCFLASRGLKSQPLPVVMFTVIALAIPVALAGAYGAAISQIRTLSYYKLGGWGYAIFSRRLFASLFWLIWSILSSFLLLLQLSLLSTHQWVVMIISPFVYFGSFYILSSIYNRELKKPYIALSYSTKYSVIFSSIAMTIVLAIVYQLIGSEGGVQSLREAIDTQRANIQGRSQSDIIEIALTLLTLADGVKHYLAGRISISLEYLQSIVASISLFIVFFNASLTYSSFVIARTEYRRVFGVPSEDQVPPPLKGSRVALIAGAFALVVFFAYVPLIGQIETAAKNNQPLQSKLGVIEKKLVEKIDSTFYQPGTTIKIKAINSQLLTRLEAEKALVSEGVDKAFYGIEGNVVRYLDWYYSLEAEYMRLGKMLTGQIEEYMQVKLEEYLSIGNPTADLQKTIDSALATQQTLREEYQRLRLKILDENRVPDSEDQVTVVSSTSLDSLITIPTHIDLVSLDQRVAGGTVAAGIGSLIAGKIARKAIFKGAAKAVVKAAAAKVAGTTIGGGVGAAMGSVVPGFGTVVGGFIGGLIAGVFVDAVLLKLEEVVSRDEFHKEIVSTIVQTREDFKRQLRLVPR
jgi:hypothetical protein